MLNSVPVQAVELSALRDHELTDLITSLQTLDLSNFRHVSVHAPSFFRSLSERQVLELLSQLKGYPIPLIVHPDILLDTEGWNTFGRQLCIENMDKRKPIGRTAAELTKVFRRFPNASFCFDIGHARQIDPSMYEACAILRTHRSRLTQVHMSDVNSSCGHEPLSRESILAFRQVSHLLPSSATVILETPVTEEQLTSEVRKAETALGLKEVSVRSAPKQRRSA